MSFRNNQQPTISNQQSAFAGAFAGKRVLLTGHTGFKGAWLAEWLLALGAEVTGFALPPPTTPALFDQLSLASRLQHIEGDVRDLAAVRAAFVAARPDFVFHLAAQPLVRLSYDQPTETFATNILGTAHVLEALRDYQNASKGNPTKPRVIAAVMVTTDKCYQNREWVHSYREEDPMGGHDPYSASKGAAELVIASYRDSYFSAPDSPVRIASARAGNVIGGGDWALDRIVPDCIRALVQGATIPVRNKVATRPWQHVLEPLSGYLWLATALASSAGAGAGAGQLLSDKCQLLSSEINNPARSAAGQLLSDKCQLLKSETNNPAPCAPEPLLKSETNNQQLTTNNQIFPFPAATYASSFNFGPALASNRTVAELVQEIIKHWPGKWEDKSDPKAVHEAQLLNLATDKAHHFLGWSPAWNFAETIAQTIHWYRTAQDETGEKLLSDACQLLSPETNTPQPAFSNGRPAPTSNQQPTNNNLAHSAIHLLTTRQIASYTESARTAGLAWARR